MRVVYVAGPYAARTLLGRIRNILRAWRVAAWVWHQGGVGICPHSMTALMDRAAPRRAFLEGDLELLRRASDAVLVLPGWERSSGTQGEIREAERVGLPLFYWPDDLCRLEEWLREE